MAEKAQRKTKGPKTSQLTGEEDNEHSGLMAVLTGIESNQATLLKEFVGLVRDDLKELKHTVGLLTTEHRERRQDMKAMEQRLRVSEGIVARMSVKLASQAEEIVDLISRSLRDNLIFQGIPDTTGETNEETEKKLANFMKKELKITDAGNIALDRVHRMGNRRNGTRTVVAKFNSRKGKDIVLQVQIPTG